jgi:UDP-glucose 4-epimerase
VRDYIHVTDLSRAHVAALAYLSAGGASLVDNCGYGHGYSVLEVLSAVERVSRKKLKVKKGPRRAGDPASIVADPSLIRKSFNWRPEHDNLDFIVRTALAWEEALGKRNQRE